MRGGAERGPWMEEGVMPLQRAGGATPELEEHLDLGKYFLALQRRWQVVVACLLVTIGYAVVQYTLTPKEYRASTILQIERKRLATLAMGQTAWLEDWWNMEYYPTQYRLLRSRGMAERVLVHLGLHRDLDWNPGEKALLGSEEESGDASNPDSAADAQLARMAMGLQGRLEVNPLKETQLVELSFRSTSPEDAARIVNAYADVFIAWGLEDRSATVNKASRFLDRQIQTLRNEIEEEQIRLNSFIASSDFALDPAGEALVERQQLLRKQRDAALTTRLNREAAFRELTSLPEEIAVANTPKAARINELKGEVFRLESEYENKLETFKPDWPEMQQLRDDIDTKSAELALLVEDTYRAVVEQASADLQGIRREESALNEELRKLADDARLQNSDALQYNNIITNIDTRKELLTELVKRQSEVASAVQTTQESNVRVVDRAIVPAGAFRPSLKRGLVLAMAFGLFLGVGIVFVLEFFDRTIKTSEELESLLGLPTLTVIPDLEEGRGGRYGKGYGYSYGYALKRKAREAKAEGGDDELSIELVPHHRPRLAVSEAYRSLRTALLLSSADELRLVLVTSAQPGEGKTTTSSNLGVVMAQLGRRVLVIDADLRRPNLHKVFKVSNRVGLVNYLTGSAGTDKIFFKTQVPNLTICPSGPIPPNPSELLSSDRLRELLLQVRTGFDFVILDTPPALPVADAVILGPLADGLVLCARAGVLTRDEAKLLRERVGYADLKIFGTVLNRYRSRQHRYGRRYQYYGSYEETSTPRTSSHAA